MFSSDEDEPMKEQTQATVSLGKGKGEKVGLRCTWAKEETVMFSIVKDRLTASGGTKCL